MKKRKIGKAQKKRRRHRKEFSRLHHGSRRKNEVRHPMDQEAIDVMAYMSAALLFRRGRPKTEEQSEQDKDSVG